MVHFSLLSPLLGGDSVPAVVKRGRTVLLRPLAHGDAATLDDVFAGLSPESRERRFLAPVPRLPGAMRRMLVDVDGCRHVAWAAWAHDAPIGIARYVRTAPRVAEVAFEVVDTWHGFGVGGALLDVVTSVAALNGVRRIQASVLPDNRASLRLLGQVGLHLRPSQGLLEGESPLTLMPEPRVDRAAVAALALQHRSGRSSGSERPLELAS